MKTEDIEKTISQCKENITKMQSRAENSYNNIIIGVGYIGFLTAWQGLKELLPKRDMINSIEYLLISMALFVLYQIITNVSLFGYLKSQWKLVQKLYKDFEPNYIHIQKNDKIYQNYEFIVWIIIFSTSLISGLMSAYSLFYGINHLK